MLMNEVFDIGHAGREKRGRSVGWLDLMGTRKGKVSEEDLLLRHG
jgi:hypothetical protein